MGMINNSEVEATNLESNDEYVAVQFTSEGGLRCTRRRTPVETA